MGLFDKSPNKRIEDTIKFIREKGEPKLCFAPGELKAAEGNVVWGEAIAIGDYTNNRSKAEEERRRALRAVYLTYLIKGTLTSSLAVLKQKREPLSTQWTVDKLVDQILWVNSFCRSTPRYTRNAAANIARDYVTKGSWGAKNCYSSAAMFCRMGGVYSYRTEQVMIGQPEILELNLQLNRAVKLTLAGGPHPLLEPGHLIWFSSHFMQNAVHMAMYVGGGEYVSVNTPCKYNETLPNAIGQQFKINTYVEEDLGDNFVRFREKINAAIAMGAKPQLLSHEALFSLCHDSFYKVYGCISPKWEGLSWWEI